MKKAVNGTPHTCVARILALLLLLAGLLPCDALAADVRWEILPDRERVTVTLNKEEGFAGGVTRVSSKGLLLELGVPTSGMGQSRAPENAKFFSYSEPRGRALGFFMKTAGFGFIATRPEPNTVVINAFADPLGERWTPNGVADKPARAGDAASNVPSGASPSVSSGQPGGESAPEGGAQPAPAVSGIAEATGAPGVVRGVIVGKPTGEGAAPPAAQSPRNDTPPVGQRTSGDPAPAGQVGESRPATGNAAPSSSPPPSPPAQTSEGVIRVAAPSLEPPVTVFRSRINTGGPDNWLVVRDAPPPSATPEGEHGKTDAKEPEQPPAKVYTDSKGNPIPPPPDPVEALAEIRKEIGARNYKGALDKVTPLLTHPELTREQMEEVLHLNSEMLFMVNQNELAAHYDAIVGATITAMNYNQKSPRNAAAYLRLGYINLQVGNVVEADAYFTRMRRQYPLDENIPLTYYYWGDYYYKRNEMQQAADQFQYIISNHSESKIARDAALGLARSYTALGYFQEAFDIIDYVERRWPRLYLQSPPVLELMGDVALHNGNLDFALDKYMIYYNLMPNGPSADVILSRIGDVYAHKRMLGAAKTAYMEAERRFPKKDGGLVAMMRLAEVGINDAPEVEAMFSVFKGPFTLKPAEIYTRIIKEHPDSPLVPLAQLKLAMWYLWSKKYEQSLALCSDLVKRFPKHELAPRAEEVAMKAFTALATEGATQNRSGQVIASWSANPIIKKQEESLSPESRVALAVSMWKQNDPEGALITLAPMFLGRKDPRFGEQALTLALTIYHDNDQWQEIEKLATQTELWELTDKTKTQFDYLLALARENTGKSAEAAPIWTRLAGKAALSDPQKAYVEYFLARDAENNRRLQDAYLLGRSALNRFLQIAQASPGRADTGKINSLLASLMDICETSGRLNEALEYATQYMGRLPENDPQRQGMLFRIAGIYRKQGNTPEWRKALTELVEKYPDSTFGRAAASTLRSSKLAEDASQFAPGGQL